MEKNLAVPVKESIGMTGINQPARKALIDRSAEQKLIRETERPKEDPVKKINQQFAEKLQNILNSYDVNGLDEDKDKNGDEKNTYNLRSNTEVSQPNDQPNDDLNQKSAIQGNSDLEDQGKNQNVNLIEQEDGLTIEIIKNKSSSRKQKND